MTTVTWSETDRNSNLILSNDNLTIDSNATFYKGVKASHTSLEERYYLEFHIEGINQRLLVGIAVKSLDSKLSYTTNSTSIPVGVVGLMNNGTIQNGNTTVSDGVFVTGDTIGVSFYKTIGLLEFYRNGIKIHSISNLNTSAEWLPIAISYTNGSTLTANFGATPFKYAIPSGYKAYYFSPVNKILISNEGSYKKWDTTWQTVTTAIPTEQQYIDNGMDNLSTIPESALKELKGEIKLSYFTDNPSTNEITIETETEPYSIYDEFGYDVQGNPLPIEVLYYTDDPTKISTSLEITANYSPLDEINEDFEVVTWTDEDPAERILSLTALPKPQFIKQIDPNDVYGTITEFLTTESFSGAQNGVIRYLLSPDKTTWKTWNGTTFTNIDISNMINIVASGMKRATLQSLTSSEWSKWTDQKLYLGIYLEEDVRDKTKAHIDSISYKDSIPKESTQISDAKLYILNTVSTIDVTFAGSTITGVIDDEDEGKVQYRIKLNGNDYFPADGSFTPLMASPLNISTTLANDDILIDENNTLRIEFKDYWGSIDYWQTNFIGAYSGLLFLDETGEYYSTDIGGILQYLDFGVIIAGQTTIEQAILLRNTYGYTVDNINIRANQAGFPNGMKAQFGTNEISFEALDVLNLEGQMEDGDERTFYIRLSTQLGVTPQATGEFDIIVTADKVEEVEV